MSFILRNRTKMSRFTWNHKRPEVGHRNPEEKSKAGIIILPNFKLYYRDMIIKTAW